jgi:hypothetical protein
MGKEMGKEMGRSVSVSGKLTGDSTCRHKGTRRLVYIQIQERAVCKGEQ